MFAEFWYYLLKSIHYFILKVTSPQARIDNLDMRDANISFMSFKFKLKFKSGLKLKVVGCVKIFK